MSLFPARPECWIETPPPPGPPDLLPGLLARQGHLLIIGETEVGKTLVALEIAHSVLTGEKLWGKVEPTAIVPFVTYIMGEHHQSLVHSLWKKMGLVVPPKTLNIIPPSERRVLVSHGNLIQGNRDCYRAWCQGSGVVIFDPLNAFVSGQGVEDDSVPMRACINAMGDIAFGNGASLVILGHMGKPSYDPKEGKFKHRQTYAARGSSAIEDAVTGLYYMEADAHNHGYRLTRRKFKGDAPNFYRLHRNPETLCHTLTAGGMTQQQISDLKREAGRLGGLATQHGMTQQE